MLNSRKIAPIFAAAMATLTAARPPHIFRPAGSVTAARRHDIGGAVAQLGERYVRNVEVVGSIPISSTNKNNSLVRNH